MPRASEHCCPISSLMAPWAKQRQMGPSPQPLSFEVLQTLTALLGTSFDSHPLCGAPSLPLEGFGTEPSGAEGQCQLLVLAQTFPYTSGIGRAFLSDPEHLFALT